MVDVHWPHPSHWMHWPHWAEETVSEVEHEGPIQMLGFVFAVTIMAAAFLLAVSMLLAEAV